MLGYPCKITAVFEMGMEKSKQFSHSQHVSCNNTTKGITLNALCFPLIATNLLLLLY